MGSVLSSLETTSPAYLVRNYRAYEAAASEYDERFESDLANDWGLIRRVWGSIGSTESASVLDVGCGAGADLRLFSEFGATVTGLELSDRMAKIARDNNPQATVFRGDILKREFVQQFDLVFAKALVHLFPSSEVPALLDALVTRASHGGHIYIATTVHEVEREGYERKDDYRSAPLRFRRRFSTDGLLEMADIAGVTFVDFWQNVDPRNGKTWANLIVRRD